MISMAANELRSDFIGHMIPYMVGNWLGHSGYAAH